MIDVKKIQADFAPMPAGPYLDSAATSLTPTSVLIAVDEYYKSYRANVHRGMFKEAIRATDEYEKVRTSVAAFIGAADSKEVMFTAGATDASNMLLRMLEESGKLKGKTNIVTTEMEHHGALVPMQQLALRTHVALRTIPIKMNGLELDYATGEGLIDSETAIVSIILASNVTGTINDVRRIADIAHKHGAIVVVDATAAMGHIPVHAHDLDADALYFSGHKMFAPTGVGVLWVALPLLASLSPSQFGGHMIAHVENDESTWAPIPERFEAGTKNISGVIGLGAALRYIEQIGIDEIHAHCAMLAFYAIHKLEQIPGIQVFSPCDGAKNVGIVSFAAVWAHPHDIADVLAREDIAVRPGHHCAMPLHAALKTPATIRASFHIYNTKADVDALILSLEKSRQIFI